MYVNHILNDSKIARIPIASPNTCDEDSKMAPIPIDSPDPFEESSVTSSDDNQRNTNRRLQKRKYINEEDTEQMVDYSGTDTADVSHPTQVHTASVEIFSADVECENSINAPFETTFLNYNKGILEV